MYRHVNVNKILSIKYYTDVPIDTFKRFSLPASDLLTRQGDLYKLTYISILENGLLDPLFCYDLVNVNLNNPPIYKGRKLHGALLSRGNIRWLVCKDLGITHVNSIVVSVDHGCKSGNLFTGTDFKYSSVKILNNCDDINNCYVGYNPDSSIEKKYVKLNVPSLVSVLKFGVTQDKSNDLIKNFNYDLPKVDYSSLQRLSEK